MPARLRWLAAAVAALPAALAQVAPVDDLDVWWLLKTGEYMVTTGSFPRVDPFSWTAAGAPWINHTWGFELILYAAYLVAGSTGLIALAALFALATFGVMYRTLRREGLAVPYAVALIWLAGLVTRGFWLPRPQLVTYLGLALLWAILLDYREGRADRVWWLPVLIAVWVNLHGGFFIALAVMALAAVGLAADHVFPLAERPQGAPGVRRLAMVWLACLGATLLNPFHVHALTFPLEVAADAAAKDFIIEWFSPAFQYPQLRLFEAMLLFFVAALPAVRRVRVGEALVIAVFVHLTLDATRNIPLFVIVLLPLVGRFGLAAWGRLAERTRVLGSAARPRAAAAACLLLVVPVVVLRDLTALRPASVLPRVGVADIYPAAAADFLLRTPRPGPMFNDYGWGGYLSWRLYPHYRVFMDGRVAIYAPDVREDFLTINNGRSGWREALERRGIRLVLVRQGTALAGLLRAAPEWRIAYQDGRAVVFERETEGGA